MDEETRIGTIEHYYPKVHAAVVKLDHGDLHVGDTIHIVGRGVDMRERVSSLELDHRPVHEAHDGDRVGCLVSYKVADQAEVFVVREEPNTDEDARWL